MTTLPVTADTVVTRIEPRDIGLDLFVSVQRDASSPAAEAAAAAYADLATYSVSIAFLLAVFHHESTYATNPAAIVVRYDTKNPGNCRSSRTGAFPIVQTPRGPFVDYPTWVDGWNDLAYRLIDPFYVYVSEGWTTIQQIIERFAPASDDNVPTSYIAAVVADMNRWIAGESVPEAQVPGFVWVPDVGEYGYPQGTHGRNGREIDRLIMHCTIGTDSLAWLTGRNGNSVHFLDHRDGRPRAQMVLLADAAWGAGNREYNLRGVNYEHECTGAEMLNPAYWTDSIIDNMAGNCAGILHACPKILPDREHVIGHVEVPDQDHTDPGPNFPWPRFMAALNREVAPSPPRRMFQPGNPWGEVPIVGGFLDYVIALGTERYAADVYAGIASIFGFAMAVEYRATDGNVYQQFERCWLQWTRDTPVPWDVVLLRRDDEPPGPVV